MSRKASSDTVFHELPPLPRFEDEVIDSASSDVLSARQTSSIGSPKKTLAELSEELETELHRSDLFRKEELSASREVVHDTKDEKALFAKPFFAKVDKGESHSHIKKKHASRLDSHDSLSNTTPSSVSPIVESVSDAELFATVDDEVSHHKRQFDAVDSNLALKSGLLNPSKPQNVDLAPSISLKQQELDAAHKRQQDYFDTLRARMDHETRERQEHVKQKVARLAIKEDEMLKWEAALLKKEKRIANNAAEYQKIKSLERELEDKTISLTYEKSRVSELESQLKKKEAELNEFEKRLKLKETQLHALGKELITRGATIERHTNEQLAHFDKEEEQIAAKFSSQLSQLHVKKPATIAKMQKSASEHFAKKISLSKSEFIEKLRLSILSCYDLLGKGDITGASAAYGEGRKLYVDFAATYGNDSSIHAEFVQLHSDIALQMR